MDRAEFLRSCSGGLCACVVARGLSAAAPEDWRLSFVRRRYARLIAILSEQMGETALDRVLRQLGAFCSSTDVHLSQFRGDVQGYCAYLRQTASGDEVTVDEKRGVITVTSPVRTDCFCPWISKDTDTPAVVCNCSLGWQRATWETVTGNKVQVELRESVLRGGSRCVFEVKVLQEKA